MITTKNKKKMISPNKRKMRWEDPAFYDAFRLAFMTEDVHAVSAWVMQVIDDPRFSEVSEILHQIPSSGPPTDEIIHSSMHKILGLPSQ